MPIIRGAASDFTTLARVNTTQTNDPEKKSRTFVAPNKAVIASVVRAQEFGLTSVSRGFKSTPFKGRIYIT